MDAEFVLISGFVLLWIIAYLLGMAYLRGGMPGLRRLLPSLAILIPILVVVLVVQQAVSRAFGSLTVGLVLMPVVLIGLIVQIRRIRHRQTAARAAGGPELTTPAMRRFAVIAFVVGVVGSILLAFVAARAGL